MWEEQEKKKNNIKKKRSKKIEKEERHTSPTSCMGEKTKALGGASFSPPPPLSSTFSSAPSSSVCQSVCLLCGHSCLDALPQPHPYRHTRSVSVISVHCKHIHNIPEKDPKRIILKLWFYFLCIRIRQHSISNNVYMFYLTKCFNKNLIMTTTIKRAEWKRFVSFPYSYLSAERLQQY